MLKMILVDDERVIRETISRLIDWKSYGIEIVGLCQNGLEALDLISKTAPDIVLTDIKMPGLDGLELVKKATISSPNTQFILLTGYGEFEYAREAMRFGVRHYLLKPCDETEILGCIRQMIPHCYEKRIISMGGGNSCQSAKNDNVFLTQSQKATYSSITRQVLDYVADHLDESGITLKHIAKNCLYMNVDYVNKKFVRETGQRFSDYLTDMRIQKAKEIIAAGEKVQTAADRVGCGNHPHYFSQLFKKKTGMTPTDYMNLVNDK